MPTLLSITQILSSLLLVSTPTSLLVQTELENGWDGGVAGIQQHGSLEFGCAPFHEGHLLEIGVHSESCRHSTFGVMQLHVILMSNRHPLHQVRDNLCKAEVLAITGNWYNAVFQGCKLFVVSQVGLRHGLQSPCGWHSVVSKHHVLRLLFGGSGGHPTYRIPTNRGDPGQIHPDSKLGCQLYQTGTNWLYLEFSFHDPQGQQVTCPDEDYQLHGSSHFYFYPRDIQVHELVESQLKHTVIFAFQIQHDGQLVPLQHLELVNQLNFQPRSPVFCGLLLLSTCVTLAILGVRGLKQSLGFSHTAFDCHRQCLITSIIICSGLDREDIDGRQHVSDCLKLLVRLVEQHEQVLFH
uniref:Uncharacterized protein n=1 Tax=Rousettus aegyptiacus TaxID=9407 RepID=A0A7J8HR77_ROUAE|nr:hypothetical protein HJG63_010970 [Rousettus aegyptiacus]